VAPVETHPQLLGALANHLHRLLRLLDAESRHARLKDARLVPGDLAERRAEQRDVIEPEAGDAG
jgi:hypothetical protein